MEEEMLMPKAQASAEDVGKLDIVQPTVGRILRMQIVDLHG
jgi:hypothetical protein